MKRKTLTYLMQVISGQRKGWRASLILGVLTLLEQLYRLLSAMKRRFTRKRRLPVPLISIGNLVAGGTGKTPTVIWLVHQLQAAGFHPGILTRGYGGTASSTGILLQHSILHTLPPEMTGDEPYLLAKLLPDTLVAVGRDRYQGGLQALQADPAIDCLILDDGFQFWQLERNFDIVLIDSTNPFGNGRLIPRGTLREPVSALKRAGAVLLTRVEQSGREQREFLFNRLEQLNPGGLHSLAFQYFPQLIPLNQWRLGKPGIPVQFLNGQTVAAATGIGNPEQFYKSVEQLGACIDFRKTYPDHYQWTGEDLQALIGELRQRQLTKLIVTAKDGVKLENYLSQFEDFGLNCYVLSLELQIEKSVIIERIIQLVKEKG